MSKLICAALLTAGLLGGTSYVRLTFHLGEVKLVHWHCPSCQLGNVSDVNDTLYPSCHDCGEKLGWEEMAVAEGL